MPWNLERNLKNLSTKVDPDPRFVSGLERRLKLELGHPLWWLKARVWIVTLVSLVTIAGSVTGVYAYSSDDVTPDHPLYGLRQTIESVETATALTPAGKVKVEVNHLARRVKEQRLVKAKHKTVSPEVTHSIQKKLKRAAEEIDRLRDMKGTELQRKIHDLKREEDEIETE